MNIIEPGETLLAPSICFLCEEAPQVRVIDTARHFITQAPTKLSGRKYVCASCATDLGKAIGQVDKTTVDAWQHTAESTADELAYALLRVEQLETIHVGTLKSLLAKATTPAPKPAAKKAPAE